MNEKTHEHPLYGAVSRENGWVPAPGYVLRRDRVLDVFRGLARGRLLEVGCGAGALLRDLEQMGFACTGLELGARARTIARAICGDRPGIVLVDAPAPDWNASFDYVAAFEVLEHIEDDAAALGEWHDWLAGGGKLLLSVPAGPERWNASDVWAGHFRRYTRSTLTRVLREAGFELEHFETYGFPLSNWIEPVRALHHARVLAARGAEAGDKHAGTIESGIERTLEGRLYPLQASWLGTSILRAACKLQRAFAHRELGTGYLVVARRADAGRT
ncbi:MAG TPA: class I SAM-dependent methyltransferase [Polyangiaceae bacterium]|jgi:SAM-dependent methyltransferase|nr:class I SAM-dependent methyltransferase [Polyangiaceae bacterium]